MDKEETSDAQRRLAFGLALVRIGSGALALVAPRVLHRLSGLEPDVSQAAITYTRYFGTRALGLGISYLMADERLRRDLVRLGVLVDGGDTIFAAGMLAQGTLPVRTAAWLMLVTGSAAAIDIANIRRG